MTGAGRARRARRRGSEVIAAEPAEPRASDGPPSGGDGMALAGAMPRNGEDQTTFTWSDASL
jgi:hypothetical protein